MTFTGPNGFTFFFKRDKKQFIKEKKASKQKQINHREGERRNKDKPDKTEKEEKNKSNHQTPKAIGGPTPPFPKINPILLMEIRGNSNPLPQSEVFQSFNLSTNRLKPNST